ncbi:MAG: sugar MFS transporter [Flavobacteriales bacterium]|nr:sugar MFS transporter [Flavobacteriales bacterium]
MKRKSYGFAFSALTALFFIWGFITVVVDAFIPRLKEVFELSYGQAGLIQVAWFLAYLFLSIPGGILVAKIGYKKGIMGGLAIAGLGCLLFYPAAAWRVYGLFLCALFVLAGGITILQVAANPFVSVLGPEEKASSRLNLSQAFNSLGTTIAPIFSAAFLLSDSILSSREIETLDEPAKVAYLSSEASAVQLPFILIGIALIALASLFGFIKLPRLLDDSPKSSLKEALKHNNLRMGVVGIFLYVGAEVAIGSYLTNYFLSMNLSDIILNTPSLSAVAETLTSLFSTASFAELDEKAVVGAFVVFYWGGAMAGRFVGSFLTGILAPQKVLGAFAVCAVVLLAITINTSGLVAMFSALAVGFFNSTMFPTIFTLSLHGLGDSKPQGSGLLCTAIFGGAVLPPTFGLTVDYFGFNIAFLLPVLAYLFILYLSYKTPSLNSKRA